MNLRACFKAPHLPPPADGALLLSRLVAGLAFVFHGWGKIQNPFGWMGPDASIPGIFQGLAALSEFGGGIAWMIGLLTPLASLGIGCTMAVAVCTHLLGGDPFVGRGGSYELAAVYLCLSILFIATGPGRLSVDANVFGRGCRES